MTDHAEKFILDTIQHHLVPEQFEFGVMVDGVPYDVYWFERQGKIGQVAFAIIDGKAVVAMFHGLGRLSMEVVAEKIRVSENPVPKETLH